jgi:membrane-associated phospholipid phosphatase
MTPFRNWAKNILFLLVYILSGIALVIIIEGLVTGTELTPFNTAIEAVMVSLRHPWLTDFMVWITNVGSPYVLALAAIFLSIILLLHRETYDAFLYMLIAFIALVVLKDTFHLARPDAALVGISGWSFPSGHATISTAFFFTTAYSFFDWTKSSFSKTLLVLGCIVSAGLVSFSRIYLGAHWSLDILAGIALGFLSVSFVALIFNIFLEERGFFKRKRTIRI